MGAGPGRPKGCQNKVPQQLKEMILRALDEAGGVDYLKAQAKRTPGPFLALVGKVLPLTVQGPDGGAVVTAMEVRFVGPAEPQR